MLSYKEQEKSVVVSVEVVGPACVFVEGDMIRKNIGFWL